MIFGISTACFFPNTLIEDSIDIIGKMNVKNIEVFFNCMSEYKKPFIKEIKKRINDNGISIYSIHAFSIQFEPQLFTLHARARQEAEDIYKQVLEAASELGAVVYVFHGPPNLKRAKKLVLDYPRISEITGKLADAAKESGIKLAWENVHWCWYSEPEFAETLMKMPETKNLWFTLDIKQAAQAGLDPVEFVYRTQGRLANIHVCDSNFSEERGVYPVLPFKGSLDFSALKKALADTGYDGGMILEVYANNYSDYGELEQNFNKVKSFFIK